jgi:pyruvate/oxaloacetate carboxyltransferase
MSMVNAIIGMKAGIDAIDTAITPFSEGSSHPSIEILTVFAEELGLEHGLDLSAIEQAQKELFEIAHELSDFNPQLVDCYRPFTQKDVDRKLVRQVLHDLENGTEEGLEQAQAGCRHILDELNFPDVDERMFACQIPGGMLTNLKWQLEQMGASHVLTEVMDEIPRVRSDVGYVPLVTPTSQIIGAQATNNVLAGHRYEIVSDEFRMLLNGELGKPPVSPNPDIVQQVLGVDCIEDRYRPGSYLQPVLEDPIDLPFVKSNKDLLLHHLFGSKADDFLKRHRDLEDLGTNWFVINYW